MPTVLKLLRSHPGSCITFDHVLQAELWLKRKWERGDALEKQLARQHVEGVWLAFQDLGAGTVRGAGRTAHLHSWPAQPCMPPATVLWLRRQRVPLFLFGSRKQPREVDLLALQVPGLQTQARSAPEPAKPKAEIPLWSCRARS